MQKTIQEIKGSVITFQHSAEVLFWILKYIYTSDISIMDDITFTPGYLYDLISADGYGFQSFSKGISTPPKMSLRPFTRR